MTEEAVRVPSPNVVLHTGEIALVCAHDGSILADELQGFFVKDTRVLSTYRLGIGGHPWRLLSRWKPSNARAQWDFQNPVIRDDNGEVPEGTLHLSLKRSLINVLHEDLTIRAFTDRPIRTRFTIQLDADFADIFEVRENSLPPRLAISRGHSHEYVVLQYEREGFSRGLRISLNGDSLKPLFLGAMVYFELDLSHGDEWKCCLELSPVVDGEQSTPSSDPHEERPESPESEGSISIKSDNVLELPFAQGLKDLKALSVPQTGAPPYIAAGAPWFLTLFGRDTLVTSLISGIQSGRYTEGALHALGVQQAKERDDWRDAEPGKILHEVRHGELVHRGQIPHSPYYGAHDAPALYCLALWNAWRWTGNKGLLDAHMDTAMAALQWCDEAGDRDGDGLLEYATRSRRGYRNQGWKDAGDAIVYGNGRLVEPPVATIELQGYLYAARLAMAELLEEGGRADEAKKLRNSAARLRDIVEECFWMEHKGFYALALDRDKRTVTSISSNPGHLLWSGLPAADRAARVVSRMLEPDMFTGWGLRTLSDQHPGYNPLSYQKGSVWPHDNAIAAAGMMRYGLREEASKVLKAVLEAAGAFEEHRLPELFCGFNRSNGLPVPYFQANAPQAWAAAAPLLAVQLFLGLVPDAPRGKCYISPWLPEWLPRLEAYNISFDHGSLNIKLTRSGNETVIEQLDATGIEIIHWIPESPLWGTPIKEIS